MDRHDQDERESAFLVFGRIVEGIAVNGVLHVPSKPYQLELPALPGPSDPGQITLQEPFDRRNPL